MKKNCFIAGLLLIFFFFGFTLDDRPNIPSRKTSTPKEFFVSETGDNSNTGLSIKQPLRTIGEAVNRMKEGDRCSILAGTYREFVVITTSNITLTNYKGANVIISGLDVVSNWKPYSEKIYQASFIPTEKDNSENSWHLNDKGKYFTQVFANGEMMTQARYPNLANDILNWQAHGEDVEVYVGGKVRFTGDDQKQWKDNQWRNGIFHAIVEKKFNAIQGVIDTQNKNEIDCKNLTSAWRKSTQQNFEQFIFSMINNQVSGIGKGFITNHLNAIDTQGEWHWDKKSNILYLRALKDVDPNTIRIEAKSRKLAFQISNCADVKIEGIKIIGAGIDMSNTTRCLINKCNITYPIPFYIHHDEYNGKSNISISGNHNVLRNCYVGQSWGSGVEIVSGENNIIENNIIEDVNWMGTYNACIRAGGNGTKVLNNTLRKSGRFLIQGTGIKNGLIAYNDMYNGMLIGQDGGAFYTYVQDGLKTEISYNWIHDIKGVPWERSEHNDHNISVGIYLDGGCQNFNVHHNVIWNTRYAIMYNATPGRNPKISQGNKFNNNTCFVTGTSAIVSKNIPQLYVNNQASNNLTNKKVSGLSTKEGNIIDDTEAFSIPFRTKNKTQKQNLFKVFQTQAGAYTKNNAWHAGADTTKVYLQN